ncbi:MAG: pknB, partial [Nocardioidaceae bacterium]|nr:pknB [Nocardioidaceae bacterium]
MTRRYRFGFGRVDTISLTAGVRLFGMDTMRGTRMAVSSDEALVGRTLDGRYVIGKRIARGGMASVFMATDKRLDRVVAVKVMHSGLGDDDQFTDRFVREARSAAKLNHPNVVSVFDQGTDGDVTYLVMEYVPGQTLRDVMRDEAPMPPGRALALIEQVLIALSAAHAAHLIHRDVKPENVLIAPDGSTKVADFGLARAVSAATTATGGTLIGTVSYLAPEIVVNEGADARSDVYACGAVLYEMLTGFKPHAGDSPIQVAYKHVHEDIAKPSATIEGIPPYVDALVIRATARNRDQRSADASVMLKQVRQVRRALNAGLEDDPELTLDLLPSAIRHDEEETQAVDREAVAAVGLAAAAASSGAATAVVASSASSPESTAVAPFGGQPTKPHAPNAPTGLHPAMPLSEFHQVKKSAPRRRRGLILLVVALVVALLAGLGGWYYGVGRYVDAPQLVGLSLAQATSEAKAAGFTVNVKENEFDEE